MDIVSCRRYYAMEAAQRPNCRISAGIDVYEPFIFISNKVKEYLDIKNVNFYFATRDELSSRPEAYGGPFPKQDEGARTFEVLAPDLAKS